jgi:hypothetical protein
MLYRSAMIHGKNKKNFELPPTKEFIVRVTHHIPEKGFQVVCYLWMVSQQIHEAAAEGGDGD